MRNIFWGRSGSRDSLNELISIVMYYRDIHKQEDSYLKDMRSTPHTPFLLINHHSTQNDEYYV